MDIDDVKIPRKTVIAGAGVGLAAVTLAACSSGSDSGSSSSSESSSAAESTAAAGDPLAVTADVPVGSGVIVGETVVTQPVAGDFKGFSAVCPHQGCLVNEIVDSEIICPCHGSKFSLDGEVVAGPAKSPLEPVAVTVDGDNIVAG